MATRNVPDAAHYVEMRKNFLREKMKEKISAKDEEKQKEHQQQRQNWGKALELYENKTLRGPDHITYIQDGKVIDLDDLHADSPHWVEVGIAEIVVLFPFLLTEF